MKAACWFKGKKCLFLLDDIWDGEDMGSGLLLKLSTIVKNCDKTSGLVYTTRDRQINPFGVIVRFNSLIPSSPSCRNMLVKAAGFSCQEIEEAECNEQIMTVLQSCNGLKMTLAVAGRSVKLIAESYGEHRLKAWESYVATLKSFPKKLLQEDYAEYKNLYSQFAAALQTLTSAENRYMDFETSYTFEELFEALCVAGNNEVVPDTMLRRLWNLETVVQAREVARHFARVSIVEIMPLEFVDGKIVEGIRVHDLVRDFASHLADQKRLEKGWVKGWEVWSLGLLESYFAVDSDSISNAFEFRQWWEEMERNDSYFHEGLEDIIEKIAWKSQTEDGQDLSKCIHEYYFRNEDGQDLVDLINCSSNVEEGANKDASIQISLVLFLRESHVTAMHAALSRIIEEREVEVSDLTHRLLVFACLVYFRLDQLRGNIEHITKTYMQNIGAEDNAGSRDELLIRYVRPQSWDYARHCIERNWRFYEESLVSDRKSVHNEAVMLGSPLAEGALIDAGIAFHYDIRGVSRRERNTSEEQLHTIENICQALNDCGPIPSVIHYSIMTPEGISNLLWYSGGG